ncbi:MAG: aminotransferase class III-fold pyridoxal phosphate-dependent enzyme, partial [Thermodesulfobacteriota bacterium]
MSYLSQIQDREKKLLCNTYNRYPLEIASGSGCRLYDSEGNEYVDMLAGIAVCNLGHCPPEVNRVIKEQAGKLVHVSNLFYQTPQLDLAERLLGT